MKRFLCCVVFIVMYLPVVVLAQSTYDIAGEIGPSGTPISAGGWQGQDLGNWITQSFGGELYLRNANDGDNTVFLNSNGGFSYQFNSNTESFSLELPARINSNFWEMGFSTGDGEFGNTALRLGQDFSGSGSFHILHRQADGSFTRTVGSDLPAGDEIRSVRLEVNAAANGGDGAAELFVDGTSVVGVPNLNLLSGGPAITDLDTIHVRSNSRFVGPGSFTVDQQDLAIVSQSTYDIASQIGPTGTPIATGGWQGDDLDDWVSQVFAGELYLRNADDGDNTIFLNSDGSFDLETSPETAKIMLELPARINDNFWEMGLSTTDGSFGNTLARFGQDFGGSGVFHILHRDENGQFVRTTGEPITSGDTIQQIRFEIDPLANGGDGSATLNVGGSTAVFVPNLNLSLGGVSVADLDTIHVRSNSRFVGPGSFTLTTFEAVGSAVIPEPSALTLWVAASALGLRRPRRQR